MASSRKDSKGYVLRTGESQRKDGRYSYSYTDTNKIRRTVYAKTLVDLRAKEKKIQRDRDDGLDVHAAERMTLNQLFDAYISQKYDLKESTRVNYKYMYNHFVRPTFGKKIIGKIKYSDVKKFYYSLILDKGLKAKTLDIARYHHSCRAIRQLYFFLYLQTKPMLSRPNGSKCNGLRPSYLFPQAYHMNHLLLQVDSA